MDWKIYAVICTAAVALIGLAAYAPNARPCGVYLTPVTHVDAVNP